MAQRIARRLSLRRRPRDPRAERGNGALASVPYRYRSDDIDLDRTIEVLTERPVPEDTDIVVRERMRPRRAVGADRRRVRLDARGEGADRGGDRRGAVRGPVRATSSRSSRSGRTPRVLSPLVVPTTPARMLDQLLRIPARGLTNVGFGAVRRARRAGALVGARGARPCCSPTPCTTPAPTRA